MNFLMNNNDDDGEDHDNDVKTRSLIMSWDWANLSRMMKQTREEI